MPLVFTTDDVVEVKFVAKTIPTKNKRDKTKIGSKCLFSIFFLINLLFIHKNIPSNSDSINFPKM